MQIRRVLATTSAVAAALVLAAATALVAAPAAQAAPCASGTTPTPIPSPTSSADLVQCNPISVTVVDAPTSVGLVGDWNYVDIDVTNNGETDEYFGEQQLGLFASISGNTALTPDNLEFQINDSGTATLDLTQDGSAVAAAYGDLGGWNLSSGETETLELRFRVADEPTGTSIEDAGNSPLNSLSIAFRLAYSEDGSEGDLIGSDVLDVAVKTLVIDVPAAIKPLVGTPIAMTTTTTNSTGSYYGPVVMLPFSILGEESDAPPTLRKAVKRLRALAAETRTTVEFRAPGGSWVNLDDDFEGDLEDLPFIVEELRNGHSFSTDWRFTFNDASKIGNGKSIVWASMAINISNQQDLRRPMRGTGDSAALIEEGLYFVSFARTALGVTPATTPPPSGKATTPAAPPVDDQDDDSDRSGDDDRDGDDENGGVAPTGLADTGANSNEHVAFAALLLLAGAAIMIGTRRREGAHQ